MAHFAHVIFDLDGTLADTSRDLAAAANHVLEAFGLPQVSVAQVVCYVGCGARVLVERVLGPKNAQIAPRGFQLFMEYYQAHLLDNTRLYTGIELVLATARAQGVVLSLLTNKPEAASRAILAGLRLAPLFAAVVGGDTLATKKPDPAGVTYLQHFSGVDLRETLLIGDSVIDVETGCAAGTMTCGVTWGFGAEGLIARSPDFLVNNAEELSCLIASGRVT